MAERDPTPVLRELAREYRIINRHYFNDSLAPLPLAISESSGRLGSFRSDPRRMELSLALLFEQPWGVVVEVLKHEMAHQFVAEVLGEREESSHGPSFQRTCERLGIDARASGLPRAGDARSPILDRVRKLLSLAGSSNQHEAEAAMRQAHRLMLKHNLQQPTSQDASDFGFRHLGRYTGRVSEAENVLAGLLGEFFFVQPIWVSVFRREDQKRVSVLEITGRHDNLAMAEYVYGFMQHAADSLWRAHKRKHKIAGDADRRAFLAGVMRGFAEKLRLERKSEEAAGLIWVADPQANGFFRRRHPRIRNAHYGSSERSAAAVHGRAAGRELVLNRPLAQGSGPKIRALPRGD